MKLKRLVGITNVGQVETVSQPVIDPVTAQAVEFNQKVLDNIDKDFKESEKQVDELVKENQPDSHDKTVKAVVSRFIKENFNIDLSEDFIKVASRKDLGRLIENAKQNGIEYRISRCLEEGYRYIFTYKFPVEKLNEEILDEKKKKDDEEIKIEEESGIVIGIPDVLESGLGLELDSLPMDEPIQPEDKSDIVLNALMDKKIQLENESGDPDMILCIEKCITLFDKARFESGEFIEESLEEKPIESVPVDDGNGGVKEVCPNCGKELESGEEPCEDCKKEIQENKKPILVKDINVGDIVGEFDNIEDAQKFIDDDLDDHNYEIVEESLKESGDIEEEFDISKDNVAFKSKKGHKRNFKKLGESVETSKKKITRRLEESYNKDYSKDENLGLSEEGKKLYEQIIKDNKLESLNFLIDNDKDQLVEMLNNNKDWIKYQLGYPEDLKEDL